MNSEENIARMLANAEVLRKAEVSESDARDAIDGYLQAAEFTATDESGNLLDGLGLSWSEDAQREARDTVVDFIEAGTPDDLIRRFAKRFSPDGYLQVGIDLLLTRNREGAGFWDRANVAEEVCEALTELAHKLPEVRVVVGESGEMEFEGGVSQ